MVSATVQIYSLNSIVLGDFNNNRVSPDYNNRHAALLSLYHILSTDWEFFNSRGSFQKILFDKASRDDISNKEILDGGFHSYTGERCLNKQC